LAYRQHHVEEGSFQEKQACHIYEFGHFCDNAFGKWFRI
jgi:hypothetical protein